MSVAYYIVLDRQDVEFDRFVDGKSIAQAFDDLSEFCAAHGIKSIQHFEHQDVSEFMDEFDDSDLPEQSEVWFEASEGVEWASTLIEKLKADEPKFLNDGILADLDDYLEVFRNADRIKAKWRLELDF